MNSNVQESLKNAVAMLSKDLDDIQDRVTKLEQTVNSNSSNNQASSVPSPGTLAFILLWPFAAQGIVKVVSAWKRN